jgi:hypothetical protein
MTMDLDWKQIVGTVAPALATALGGPLAGMATRAVAGAVLGDEDAQPEAVEAAILAGGPDVLVKLREADRAFAVRMRELDVDLERITAGDRDSARQRESRTGDTFTPRALAFLITCGFFGVLFWLLRFGKPDVGGDALLVMLGSLGTAWTGVINYFYGSNKNSAEKTSLSARATGVKS